MAPRQGYRIVLYNRLVSWVGKGHANMVTKDVLEALREAGYVIVWAENLARPA